MSYVVFEEGLVIGKGGERELKVDVFRPASQSGTVPGVLFMPGGGWRNCDRAALAERYGYPLANHGYVCVNGEYRVMDEAPWPAQIHDVKMAIRWVRANSSSLGIDPSQIVIAGKSSGGQLALLAAGTPNHSEFEGNGSNLGVSTEVAGVIGSSPVSDFPWAKRPEPAVTRTRAQADRYRKRPMGKTSQALADSTARGVNGRIVSPLGARTSLTDAPGPVHR